MTLSIYSGRRRFNARPLLCLMAVSACFSASVLFAWTIISVFVAEPISWATWAPLRIGSQPGLLDYPFILLWGLPLAGVFFAWIAKNVYQPKWAYFAVTTPMLILAMVFAYFYLVPLQYH